MSTTNRRASLALIAAIALLIGGLVASDHPEASAANTPGSQQPAPAIEQPNGNAAFVDGFECFTLAGGKNPGKVVRLRTSSFGDDRVTVGKSHMMCEFAFKFPVGANVFAPSQGPVFQCFGLAGGADPNREVLLQTDNFGTLKATVRRAVEMCENAIKFRPNRPPFGIEQVERAIVCYEVVDTTPTSGHPAILATNNFGFEQDEIRRLTHVCETATKFREGFAPYGSTGQLLACFAWGGDAEVNEPVALRTRNFHGDEVTVVRRVRMCERAVNVLFRPDFIIDADGFDTPFDGLAGARDAALADGTPLRDFPTGDEDAGLDWFDNDGNAQWTAGDDLHAEGAQCPTGIKNAVYDLGFDCVVLDVNGTLFNGQQVDCDLEINGPFSPQFFAFGCSSGVVNIRYHDANNDNTYDVGEDIILDANGDGVFNE